MPLISSNIPPLKMLDESQFRVTMERILDNHYTDLLNIYVNTASEKSWAFTSPTGSTGTFYIGGYYSYGASHNDFSPSITFGTANSAYAAHFFVVLGATTVDQLTITVTGTTINDEATRTASDTATIVIPSGATANNYYETPEKWIGQITVEATSGTATNCNYGWCKYWDNNNTDFTVKGLEATWRAGANDANPNILLRHHKETGWTYNAGSTPTPPAAIADMQTDHNTEYQVVNGENGAWKRSSLSTDVDGSLSEGTIIEVVTTANRAFDLGTFLLRIAPR